MDRSKWEYKKLGEVAKFIGGGTPSKANVNYYTGNIPWATVRDMVNFNLSNTELCITDQAVKESATNIVPKDTIIISTHVGLGKICLLMQDTAINQDLKGVILPQSVDKMFFASWYKSIADYIISNGKGATVKGVTMKFVNDLKIPVPSIADQQRIVAELDCLNEMIALKQEQLKEFDKLAQSIFYDMFGDPITNEKGWQKSRLEELLTNLKYGTSTPPEFSENGFKFIRATNIKNGAISDDNMFFINEKEAVKIEKCKLGKNDMIIVRSGANAGDVCRIGEEYAGHYAGYDIIFTVDSNKANTIFLNSLMNYGIFVSSVIKPLTRRAAQPHLNANQVKGMIVICPPLTLQQQFAEKIQAIEEQKELVKKSIAETQQLLDSRMDYYFD